MRRPFAHPDPVGPGEADVSEVLDVLGAAGLFDQRRLEPLVDGALDEDSGPAKADLALVGAMGAGTGWLV